MITIANTVENDGVQPFCTVYGYLHMIKCGRNKTHTKRAKSS